MTATVLVLLAVGLAACPRPSRALARLRALSPRDPAVRLARMHLLPGRGRVVLPAVAFGGAFAGGAWLVGGSAPLLPGLAGSVAGATAGVVVSAAAERRRRVHQNAATVEYVAVLAADLRAGQPPPETLDGDAPPPDRLPALAAVRAVSERTGAPMAMVLDRVEQDLRARARQEREIGSQLAGARSTAALLAVLPLVGIGLGTAMGARPLEVLFTSPRGQVALLVGAVLDALGVLWTTRIVAAAGGPR